MQSQQCYLFETLEQEKNLQQKTSISKKRFFVIGSISSGLVLICLLVGFGIQKYYQSRQPVTAYIELRVLSEDGRPVAGAEIFDKARPLGNTDSFGELRRELDVVPSDGLHILVEKKQINGKSFKANQKINLASLTKDTSKLEISKSIQVQEGI